MAKADGRQSRWDEHNQTRRQHILDAAARSIEAAGPGSEIHVQSIADAAGLGRTVVYRHFADRADLDAAVQGHILALMIEALAPSLVFEGTPVEIVHRVIGTYVGWAADHPALHAFAQQDPPGSGGQMEQSLQQIAEQVQGLLSFGLEALGADLDDDDRAALDPLVFGLVGAVFTATRRWLSRPERVPASEVFVGVLSEAVWLQIHGMAAGRGVTIEADVPVEQLLEAAAAPDPVPADAAP